MYYFCTYFDSNYAARGIALHNSLKRNCGDFQLFALCFDAEALARVRELQSAHIVPIAIGDLEDGDPELAATKPTRTPLEYFYTSTSSLLLFVLKEHPEIEMLTYLDADLYFYADPVDVLAEMEGYSIGVLAHRRPEHRRKEDTGIYNVGWVSFRHDDEGLSCLRWWRARCLEWCYEVHEAGKYADQKYLDEWPARFAGFRELQNKGANLGPWNVADYRIGERNGQVLVDTEPLIWFHFHGFRQVNRWVFNTNLGLSRRFPGRVLVQKVFRPYILELRAIAGDGSPTRSLRVKRMRPKWVQALRNLVKSSIGIVFRQYLFVLGDRVF